MELQVLVPGSIASVEKDPVVDAVAQEPTHGHVGRRATELTPRRLGDQIRVRLQIGYAKSDVVERELAFTNHAELLRRSCFEVEVVKHHITEGVAARLNRLETSQGVSPRAG